MFNRLRKARKSLMEWHVAKLKDSPYVSRRSQDWLKIVWYEEAKVFISGYRKDEFGRLACVEDDHGRKRPVVIIELGVPPKHSKAFYSIAKQLATGQDLCLFRGSANRTRKNVH